MGKQSVIARRMGMLRDGLSRSTRDIGHEPTATTSHRRKQSDSRSGSELARL